LRVPVISGIPGPCNVSREILAPLREDACQRTYGFLTSTQTSGRLLVKDRSARYYNLPVHPGNKEIAVITRVSGKLVQLGEAEARIEVGSLEYEIFVPEFVRRQLQA